MKNGSSEKSIEQKRRLSHNKHPPPPVIYTELNDSRLVAKCLKDETDAWSELVKRYHHTLVKCCYRELSPYGEQEVLEGVQESWIAIIQNLHTFNWESMLITWLIGVAINVCRTQRRRKQKAKTMFKQMEGEDFEIPDLNHPSPISILIKQETIHKIGKFMMTLSDTNRLVFKLYNLNLYCSDNYTDLEPREIKVISQRTGKSIKTIFQEISKLEEGNIKRKDKIIAQILNLKAETVRTKIKRIRTRLKKYLEEDGLNENKD